MRSGLAFSHLLVFIALVSAIWGPKIGGYFDLMVLMPAAVLMLWMIDGRVVAPRRLYTVGLGLTLLVIVWAGIAFLLNDTSDFQGLLRSARAFISVLVLVPLFYLLASRQVLSPCSGFILLVLALFVNTLAVYAQVIFPSLQEMMSQLWGFNKPLRDVRAFGLTAGYDSAGYLAALLAASAFAASLVFRSWRWFAFFVICAGAVGFTSRTSMLTLAGLVALVFLLNIKVWKGNGVRVGLAMAGGVFAFTWYVLPMILSGVSEFEMAGTHEFRDYTSNYATTSLTDIFEQMVATPQDLWTWVLGSGEIVSWSDIGYVKILHLGGAPLLCVMIAFYVYIYRAARSAARYAQAVNKDNWAEEKWARLWTEVIGLTLILMFVGNLKNLYFFTRGYHELFLIIVALMMGFYKGGDARRWRRMVSGETVRVGST